MTWERLPRFLFSTAMVFKGSETFMMKVRGAYEAITGLGVASQDYVNDNYMEYGVEKQLRIFPHVSCFLFYHRILKEN